jgi:hypothetical protein
MNPKSIHDSLQEIRRSFAPILHDSSYRVLDEAMAGLRSLMQKSSGRSKRAKAKNWGYTISPSAPLRFRPTKVDSLSMWVDLFCTVKWAKEGEMPIEQVVQLRVWSNDSTFLSPLEREAIETEQDIEKIDPQIKEVVEKMTGLDSGRVIYRCHFDKANSGQPGPKYHVQFGGESHAGECCWLPHIISVPRIVHAPFDLVLTCELVASNFYPDVYNGFKDEPNWKSIISQSQENLLEVYYQNCVESLKKIRREESNSLLQCLWNN